MTITNTTLKKLTTQELNDLGSWDNLNVGLYRGNLKAKVKMEGKFIPRQEPTPNEYHFSLKNVEVQFIRLADEDKVPHWGVRIWDKEKKEYTRIYHPLFPIDFIK